MLALELTKLVGFNPPNARKGSVSCLRFVYLAIICIGVASALSPAELPAGVKSARNQSAATNPGRAFRARVVSPTRWVVQDSGTVDGLWDIVALDTLNAWAAGTLNRRPAVLHTSDGGLHWVLQPTTSLPENSGRGISFPDLRHGWFVGNSEYAYLSTSDGGESWQEYGLPLRFTPSKVKFVDSLYGWIVGTGDTVLHTTDGGATWVRQIIGDYYGESLLDLDFLSRTYGWAVGGGVVGPLNLRTTDGGNSWQRFHPFYNTSLAVDFIDSLHGWILQESNALTFTSDGGNTWNDVFLPQGSGANVYIDINFIDSLNGWAVGSGGFAQGEILRTTDGGFNWYLEMSDSLIPLRRIAMVDGTHGWAVGANGLIMVYKYPQLVLGDLNLDGQISAADVVMEVNKVFLDESFLAPPEAGDVNCDGKLTPADVVILLNMVFLSAPLPC